MLPNKFYGSLRGENKVRPLSRLVDYSVTKEELMQALKMPEDDYAVAAHNLMRLQLTAPAVLTGRVKMGPEPLTVYKGIDAITLTPLGALFVEACID